MFHDWTIPETGYDIPIHSVTLEQFLGLRRRNTGINGQNHDEDRRGHSDPNSVHQSNGTGVIRASFTTLVETFEVN